MSFTKWAASEPNGLVSELLKNDLVPFNMPLKEANSQNKFAILSIYFRAMKIASLLKSNLMDGMIDLVQIRLLLFAKGYQMVIVKKVIISVLVSQLEYTYVLIKDYISRSVL